MKLTHYQIANLVKKVKLNDAQSFATLYQHTYQPFYYLSLSLVKNEQDAQDAVQESYIKISSSINSLNDEKLFIAWANRIVYTTSLHMVQKQKDVPYEDSFFTQLVDHNETDHPLSSSITKERNKILMELIESLAPILKTTLILKYYQGLKLSEIAISMDCPVGTVKSRLNTAKKQLLTKAKKERIDTMLFSALAFLPFQSALAESASLVSLTGESALGILNATLAASKMSTDVAFVPAAGSAAVLSGTSALLASSGIVAMGLAASAAVLIPLSGGPHISQINLLNTAEFFPSPALLEVHIEKPQEIISVYATDSMGQQIVATLNENNSYLLKVNSNDKYFIYAIDKNNNATCEIFEITNMDCNDPTITNYESDSKKIVITLADDKSGIDYDSVFAELNDGTIVKPIQCSPALSQITFPMAENDFFIYISDLVGNQSKHRVQVV